MPRVNIVGQDRLRSVSQAPGCVSDGTTHAWIDGAAPIHLHRHVLDAGQGITIGPATDDCLAYVWKGRVEAGRTALPAGSSIIVEHGGTVRLNAGENEAVLVMFTAVSAPVQGAGGHVHLLPNSQVPRNPDLGTPGVGGGMHADGTCPTCGVWLHENTFAGVPGLSPEQAAGGIHAHSEDELIFVTSGQIRLGQRLFDAGTAIGIAADTLYGLSPGPEGMTFVNFRPGPPSAIRFANGAEMDEQAYWRDRLDRPEYLEPAL